MRVLVAEDDVVTSTRLQRILRSFGHEVEAVRDGVAAWKYLEPSAVPGVAILNGVLPGKVGLEIASKLHSRSSSPYTYIIILTSSREERETVAAFRAGADGCLPLPVSEAELAAQLMAAERILNREERFHKEIAELQELRTQTVQPAQPDHYPEPEKMVMPAAVPANPGLLELIRDFRPVEIAPFPRLSPGLISGIENIIPMSRMQACFETALRRLGYVAPAGADSIFPEPSDFTVYSAVVLEDQRLWLDLKMEVLRPVAEKLYRALVSKAPRSEEEQLDALEEVCNKCQEEWKAALADAGLEPVAPGLPTARRTRDMPSCSTAKRLRSSSFTLPGPIRVTLLEHVATVVEKPFTSISSGDVLTDPLSVPGQKLALLKRGTLLNTRYIARIHDLLKFGPEEDFTLRVIEPSPLARFMQRRSPRRTVDSLLTVIVSMDGREKQLYGRIHVIGDNGLGATIFDSLNLGQTVTLDFALEGVDFRMRAIVRHRQEARSGFEFLSVPSESARRLKEVVRALPA